MGPAPHTAVIPPIVEAVLDTPGRPIAAANRRPFEQRLGRDFSRVRLHTDDTAAASARAVDSSAYTVGDHVVFDSGRYDPVSAEGRRLLTHELAHVAQQSAAAAAGLRTVARISAPTDAAEREADRVAESGRPTRAEPVHLARNGRKVSKRGKGAADPAPDVSTLTDALKRLLAGLDEPTRANVTRNKTIAVGLVTDSDGDTHLVYTVNQNWTNPNLREAAEKTGITRWEATPRAAGRGHVGAPGDAEQLMIEAADTNDFQVKAIAVTRPVCPDCREEVRASGRGRLHVIEVGVREPRPTKVAKGGAPTGGSGPAAAPAPAPKTGPTVKGEPGKGPGKGAGPGKSAGPGKGLGKGAGLGKGVGKGVTGGARVRAGVAAGGRGGGGRAGGGLGSAVGAALLGAAVSIIGAKIIQDELDPKNAEAFDRDLATLATRVEQLLDQKRLEELAAAGRPVYLNVTIRVRYQSDVTGKFFGATVYMGMDLLRVEVSTEKLARIRRLDRRLSWKEAVKEFAKSKVGMSDEEISLSLEYPSLAIVSEPEAAPPGADSGCFIATACYGSPLAPEVELLRRFRDEVLLPTRAGRWAVAAYYRYSPPVAALLRRHDPLRAAVRHCLVAPAVRAVHRAGVR